MDLKEQRIKLKLTQTEVCKLVGVSLTAYQNWERGAMKPSKENLAKLKEVLQIKD